MDDTKKIVLVREWLEENGLCPEEDKARSDEAHEAVLASQERLRESLVQAARKECLDRMEQEKQHRRKDPHCHEALGRQTFEEVREQLRELNDDITSAHEVFGTRLQRILSASGGELPFPDVDDNKEFARLFEKTAKRVEHGVECYTCGELGTFQFESNNYRINHRKTTHGLGGDLSELRVKPSANAASQSGA